MQLLERYLEDELAKEVKEQDLRDGWAEDGDGVVHREDLPYLPMIIRTEIISSHYDHPLVGHFGIEKIRKLVAQKYYWPILQQNVETYVKGCDVYLAYKAVCYKLNGNF